jgi:hypothetical protein
VIWSQPVRGDKPRCDFQQETHYENERIDSTVHRGGSDRCRHGHGLDLGQPGFGATATEGAIRAARGRLQHRDNRGRFIERLLVNATLNANPAINAARARVPKAGLKFHVTALVCEVTGGPCKYTGRAMKESHDHLNITPAEWDAMVADFRRTLDQFKVPQQEQQELITIVGSTKNDIVKTAAAGR